jgi:GDP-4-dehydro-6-deoxy-D-mannose reductase
MRILVTGAGGLIASHLIEAAAQRGDTVRGWTRRQAAFDWPAGVTIAEIDLSDRLAIASNLAEFAPDVIVHLAAQSFTGPSWQDPAATYLANVLGTIHLVEAARALPKAPRFIATGSSAEYAEPAGSNLIDESSRLEPDNPYGASKLAAEEFVQLCVRRYGLDAIRIRPFFLVGPRKTGDVCSDFARRIVAIERGRQAKMQVGDLRPVRDMMDIRDGIDAILRIIDAGKQGEAYNICTGHGVSIGDILKTYCSMARVPIEVSQDPALVRPLDPKSKIGDPKKLEALGWKAQYVLYDTLRQILDYWRSIPD